MNTENMPAGQEPDECAATIGALSAEPVWQAARKRAAAKGGAVALEMLDRKIAAQAQLSIAGDTDPEDFIFRPLQRALQQNSVT